MYGSCNGHGLCSLWCTRWIFMYNTEDCQSLKCNAVLGMLATKYK